MKASTQRENRSKSTPQQLTDLRAPIAANFKEEQRSEGAKLAAASIPVNWTNKAVRADAKVLSQGDTQEILRAKFPGKWNEINVDLGRQTNASVQRDRLVITLNKSGDLKRLLSSDTKKRKNQIEEVQQSAPLEKAIRAFHALAEKGDRGANMELRAALEELAGLKESNTSLYESVMQNARQRFSNTQAILGEKAERNLDLCLHSLEQATASEYTIASARVFLQSLGRELYRLQPALIESELADAARRYAKNKIPSFAEIVANSEKDWARVRRIGAMSELMESETAGTLSSRAAEYTGCYLEQIMLATRSEFMSGLASFDTERMQSASALLQSVLVSPNVRIVKGQSLVLVPHKRVGVVPDDQGLVHTARELELMLARHTALVSDPMTVNDAFECIETDGPEANRWSLDPKSANDEETPAAAIRVARAIASFAVQEGGVSGPYFTEAICFIIDKNKSVEPLEIAASIYGRLVAFDDLRTHGMPHGAYMEEMRRTFYAASVGALDHIANIVDARIRNVEEPVPLDESEQNFKRLHTILNVLALAVDETIREREVSNGLSVSAHALAYRRFDSLLKSGDYVAAADSLSDLHVKFSEIVSEKESFKIDAAKLNREASLSLLGELSGVLDRIPHLRGEDDTELAYRLGVVAVAVTQCDKELRSEIETRLASYTEEFHADLKGLWEEEGQAVMNKLALLLMVRKGERMRRGEEALSAEERDMLERGLMFKDYPQSARRMRSVVGDAPPAVIADLFKDLTSWSGAYEIAISRWREGSMPARRLIDGGD